MKHSKREQELLKWLAPYTGHAGETASRLGRGGRDGVQSVSIPGAGYAANPGRISPVPVKLFQDDFRIKRGSLIGVLAAHHVVPSPIS